MNKKSPDITLKDAHTDTHTQNTTTTNLTTGCTLCDVYTEGAIRHNVALMKPRSGVYIPYLLGTINKSFHMKT